MKKKSGIFRTTKAAITVLILLMSLQFANAQILSFQPSKKSLKRKYKCEHVGVQKVKHIKNKKMEYVSAPIIIERKTNNEILVSLKTPEFIPEIQFEEVPEKIEVVNIKDSTETTKMKLLPLPVYFRYDSYRMDLVDLTQIALAVNYVNEGHSVTLIGHTDDWGSEKYNELLSHKRATIIKDMMIALGCKPELIYVKGEGEKYPISSNDHEHGRQNNRRVEFIITPSVN